VTTELRGIDKIDVVWPELLAIIRKAARESPRSLQEMIGPSELGRSCDRRIAYSVSKTKTADQESGWKATVGTAIHAHLAQIFTGCDVNKATIQPRFLIEQRVMVGTIDGEECWGSADLFDIDSGTVFDWKTTGAKRLTGYRLRGPGEQYRVQAHCYGRGFALLGYTVNTVADVFLPRDGELGETYVWSEPYDESVAVAALSRATGLAQLVQVIGLQAVVDMTPACDDQWCPVCPVRHPYGAPTKTEPPHTPSVAELFGAAKGITS
jgi:hypothetical protein